jgi:DNA polymerase-4
MNPSRPTLLYPSTDEPLSSSARSRRILCLDGDCTMVAMARRQDPGLRKEAGSRPLILVRSMGGMERVTAACPLARRQGVYPGIRLSVAISKLHAPRILPDAYPEAASVFLGILADLTGHAPKVEQEGLDRFFLDLTGCERLCGGDIAHWTGRLCQWLRRRWGISLSAGMATNKTVARLAMRAAKWGHLCEVRPGWEEGFMAGVPVYRLPGVGKVLRKRLEEFGIRKAGQLVHLGEDSCRQVLGPSGQSLWRVAAGHCDEPVEPTALHHWYAVECTLPNPDAHPERIDRTVCRLAEELTSILRKARLATSRWEMILSYSDGESASGPVTLDRPSLLDPDWIEAARVTLARVWTRRVTLRKVQLRTPRTPPATATSDLFEDQRQARSRRLYEAMDLVRQRHGDRGLHAASAVPGICSHRKR